MKETEKPTVASGGPQMRNSGGVACLSGQDHTTKQGVVKVVADARCSLTASNGSQCATITGSLLRKTIHGSRHILRQPPAIAFDVAHVEAAKRAGVQQVLVHDLDSGSEYRASMADFCSKAIRLDRGAGPQLALLLKFWQRDDAQVQTIEPPAAKPPTTARQLALWETR